jgi:hypothetical protein
MLLLVLVGVYTQGALSNFSNTDLLEDIQK